MNINISKCSKKQDYLDAYKLVSQLYDMNQDEFLSHIKEMEQSDYVILIAYDDINPVGVIGYRIGRRLYCGKYLHIDNLVIDKNSRRKGIAAKLINHVIDLAKDLNCDTVLADSYVSNYSAQNLFLQNGFHIRGFHLKHDLI